MSPRETANDIFDAIRDDPAMQAQVLAALGTLALNVATSPNASARVTSATIDGQTFSTVAAMSEPERLKVLRMVKWSIKHGMPYPRTVIPTF